MRDPDLLAGGDGGDAGAPGEPVDARRETSLGPSVEAVELGDEVEHLVARDVDAGREFGDPVAEFFQGVRGGGVGERAGEGEGRAGHGSSRAAPESPLCERVQALVYSVYIRYYKYRYELPRLHGWIGLRFADSGQPDRDHGSAEITWDTGMLEWDTEFESPVGPRPDHGTAETPRDPPMLRWDNIGVCQPRALDIMHAKQLHYAVIQ